MPLPLAPLVTISHDVALLTAVHEQPASVVSVVEPVVAPAPTEALPGVTE